MQPLRPLAFLALFLAIALAPSCERQGAAPGPFTILTPPSPRTPRINGPKVFGVRPGAPFLFQIAASGERPITFAADNLPPGLSLDGENGRITGVLSEPARHVIALRAQSSLGHAEQPFTIVVGDEIALTPPMGWNSWNCWGGDVSQEKVSAAARALVASGLRDHGWTYVNIDDGWQGIRGGEFNAIQPNRKFPDMPGLANEVHALGLKLGIYSTPWRTSFHGHIGSSAETADGRYTWIDNGTHTQFFKYRFPPDRSFLRRHKWLKPIGDWRRERHLSKMRKELRVFGEFSFVRQDVAQWAAWGIDYLKYDWVPIDLSHTEAMRDELRRSGRDIVYSLANNAPLALAAELASRANSWRTSVDVMDDWSSVSEIGFKRDRWAPFNRPGHYNDADALVLGQVGWGKPRATKLTADEQYAHMSLWALLSGPLLLGSDLDKLDPFTLGLLTNDEVLEINQDSLGKQATRVAGSGSGVVFAKPLEDGSWAVGLFNRGRSTTSVRLLWKDIQRTGKQSLRDLWRQQELGTFDDGFATEVAPHGVVLIRVTAAK